MQGLRKCWFPLASSSEVRDRPVPARLLGEPLVLFRDATGTVRMLRDRCAHRLVPLSLGTVEQGHIRCPYHGWTFDGAGRCTDIPSLPRERRLPTVCVPTFRAVETGGTVWGTLDESPYEPAPRGWIDADLTAIVRSVDIDCDYVRILENLVDNAHAAFVHRNFLRGYPQNKVRAVVRETDRGVRVDTLGEQAERSLLFRFWRRVAAGRDFEVVHVEEYIEPMMARVEYGDRAGNLKIAVQFVCIPTDEHRTRLVYRCGVRAPLGSKLLAPLVALSVAGLMVQDRRLLEKESEVARGDAPLGRGTATVSDVPGAWVARSAREYALHGPRERNELRSQNIEYLL